MKKGDPIRIHLHGHEETVEGTIFRVLKDNHVEATIDDTTHHLALVTHREGDSETVKPRVLTCSPEMYELVNA